LRSREGKMEFDLEITKSDISFAWRIRFRKGSSLIEKNRSLIKDKLGKIQEEEKIQKE